MRGRARSIVVALAIAMVAGAALPAYAHHTWYRNHTWSEHGTSQYKVTAYTNARSSDAVDFLATRLNIWKYASSDQPEYVRESVCSEGADKCLTTRVNIYVPQTSYHAMSSHHCGLDVVGGAKHHLTSQVDAFWIKCTSQNTGVRYLETGRWGG